jgi:hypothetical protein
MVIETIIAAIAAKLGSEGISRVIDGKDSQLVVRYGGYGKGPRAKDDAAIRAFFSQEIEATRNNLRNIVDILNKKKERSGAVAARECIDELDLFLNDVRTTPAKRVAFLTDDRISVSGDVIERLKDLDRQVVEKLSIVSETAKRMAQMLVEGQKFSLETEFGKMKLYLNDMRQLFKDRMVNISSLQ